MLSRFGTRLERNGAHHLARTQGIVPDFRVPHVVVRREADLAKETQRSRLILMSKVLPENGVIG